MSAWIDKRKGWLNGYRTKKKANKNLSNEKKKADVDIYGVTFTPIRCPRCNSKNVKCYSSRPKTRYYSCRNCKHRFKAVELEE